MTENPPPGDPPQATTGAVSDEHSETPNPLVCEPTDADSGADELRAKVKAVNAISVTALELKGGTRWR